MRVIRNTLVAATCTRPPLRVGMSTKAMGRSFRSWARPCVRCGPSWPRGWTPRHLAYPTASLSIHGRCSLGEEPRPRRAGPARMQAAGIGRGGGRNDCWPTTSVPAGLLRGPYLVRLVRRDRGHSNANSGAWIRAGHSFRPHPHRGPCPPPRAARPRDRAVPGLAGADEAV